MERMRSNTKFCHEKKKKKNIILKFGIATLQVHNGSEGFRSFRGSLALGFQ